MSLFRKATGGAVLVVSAMMCLAFVLFAQSSLRADEPRLPPEGDALARATAAVRGAFRDDLAKQKPEELHQVAKKILSLVEAEQDAAVRFAMLTEARAAAMRAEDVGLSFEIIHTQGAMFRVDLPALRNEVFLSMSKSAKAPAAHRDLVEQNLLIVHDLIAAGEFDAAERQLRAADLSMPKAKEPTLSKRVIDARSQINILKREAQLFSAAQSKLLEMPDDPDANFVAGRFLCCFKADWTRGLPLLVKGRDVAVAACAKSDLAKPVEAAAQATLAGQWWDASEKQTGRMRDAMQERAAHWYEAALPSLTGLSKTVAEKRLEAAAKIGEAGSGPSLADSRKPINLITGASGQRDSITGRWSIENGEIVCPTDSWARFKFNHKLQTDEFDVIIEFTRHQGNQGFGIVVKPDGKAIHFGLSALDNQFVSVGDFKGVDPKNMKDARMGIGPNGKRQQARFQIRKNQLITWLDGKMVLRYKTDLSDLGPQDWGFNDASIGLVSWYNSITFHRVEFRDMSGPGGKEK